MEGKTQRILMAIIAIIFVILVAVGAAYFFTRKDSARIKSVDAAGKESAPDLENLRTYELGEFLANTSGKKFHVVKAKLALIYLGADYYEKLLASRRSELRDYVQRLFMERTKEELHRDFVDRFLHRDLKAGLNDLMKSTGQKSRIYRVVFPDFLIQ